MIFFRIFDGENKKNMRRLEDMLLPGYSLYEEKNSVVSFKQTARDATSEFLNAEEAARYLGYKRSYLYKLTSEKKITFHKPGGKKLFFKKADLDKWREKGRQPAKNESLDVPAATYVLTHRNSRKGMKKRV